MVFRSATDAIFYGLAIALPIILVSAVSPFLFNAHPTAVGLSFAALFPLMVLPTWLLFSTYYRVESAILRIHSGPFSWAIPIEEIRSISPSQSLAIAPALSFNRFKIEYGHQRHVIYVSPKYRTAFLEALGYYPADMRGMASSSVQTSRA